MPRSLVLVLACLTTTACGMGKGDRVPSPTPGERAARPATYDSVCAGDQHTCATGSGNVYCWGRNFDGPLGDGTLDDAPAGTVAMLPGDLRATKVVCRGRATCAVTNDNALYCWGESIGWGTMLPRIINKTPQKVADGVATVAVSDYGLDACLVTTAGVVRCWGRNDDHTLGNMGPDSATPIDVAGITGAVAITLGRTHACTIDGAGAVRCWGDNSDGQLGVPTPFMLESATPVTVPGVTAKAIAAGADHTCAVLTNSEIRCWGSNRAQQLGNSTSSGSLWTNPQFADVALEPATTIAAADGHTCVVDVAGQVHCWGGDGTGQLGWGGRLSGPGQPSLVGFWGPGVIKDAAEVTTGAWHSCMRSTAGALRCWGRNDGGQLTNDETRDSPWPVP